MLWICNAACARLTALNRAGLMLKRAFSKKTGTIAAAAAMPRDYDAEFLAEAALPAPAEIAQAESRARLQKLLDGNQVSTINIRNKAGQSALHLAAANNRLDLVELLLAKGANTLIRDRQGRTVLMAGATYNPPENIAPEDVKRSTLLADVLLSQQNVEANDQSGKDALRHAVEANNIAFAKRLMTFGGSGLVPDNDGVTALDYVREKRLGAMLEILSPGEKLPELSMPASSLFYVSGADLATQRGLAALKTIRFRTPAMP